MKRILLITLLLLLALPVSAQNGARYIYLWDVTLSMKGYQGRTPDIYNDVRDFLIQNITNEIKSEDAEIVVLPFQEGVLKEAVKVVRSDHSGRQEIVDYITAYHNTEVTLTDIVASINTMKGEFIKEDKTNHIYILTDGKQKGGNAKLIEVIEQWGDDAKQKNAYATYVMLTREAVHEKIVEAIGRTDNIEVVSDFIILQPESYVVHNVKDDKGKPVVVEMQNKSDSPLPADLRIKVVADDNPYVVVNTECVVTDGKISFGVVCSEESLRATSETKIPVSLRLTLPNQENIRRTGKMVTINPSIVKMELINKPEKRLTISYE